jgi:hypothetical protein
MGVPVMRRESAGCRRPLGHSLQIWSFACTSDLWEREPCAFITARNVPISMGSKAMQASGQDQVMSHPTGVSWPECLAQFVVAANGKALDPGQRTRCGFTSDVARFPKGAADQRESNLGTFRRTRIAGPKEAVARKVAAADLLAYDLSKG